jgi:hypothetical protein
MSVDIKVFVAGAGVTVVPLLQKIWTRFQEKS